MPAYPSYYETAGHWHGLTKREYAAIAAMQGLCTVASAGYDKGPHNFAIVQRAVVLADMLFVELEKPR